MTTDLPEPLETSSTPPDYFEHAPDLSGRSSEFSDAIMWLLSHGERDRAMARLAELRSMQDDYMISRYGATDPEINEVSEGVADMFRHPLSSEQKDAQRERMKEQYLRGEEARLGGRPFLVMGESIYSLLPKRFHHLVPLATKSKTD